MSNPTEQVDAVKEARELDGWAILAISPNSGLPDDVAAFDRPRRVDALLKTLADEVERLHERFSVVCNNCGERYLGPKDESLHGYNVCDMSRRED